MRGKLGKPADCVAAFEGLLFHAKRPLKTGELYETAMSDERIVDKSLDELFPMTTPAVDGPNPGRKVINRRSFEW